MIVMSSPLASPPPPRPAARHVLVTTGQFTSMWLSRKLL
jgi:hypothetical protein